ncbi:MAG: energy transducer TonB [Qipengyuania citrea]
MRQIVSGLLVAALGASSVQAEERILEPDSKWIADYGENSCRLIRTFGKSDEQTVLMIEQFAPSNDFNWTVAGRPLAHLRWSRDIEVQWGPEFDPYERTFVKASLAKFGPALVSTGWETEPTVERKVRQSELRDLGRAELTSGLEPVLGGLDPERASRVSNLSFRQGDQRAVILRLEDLGAAAAALNKCTLDLARSWGFDESYRDRVTTTPVWLNVRKVAADIQRYYPQKALSRGAQANFKVRVIVDREGKPERCDWINNTSADAFAMSRTPCDIILADARFEPALDENEQPIRSIYLTTILYRMS